MQIAAKQYVNRCRAFTLVELILVVGTIGMVTGALVGVIGNSTKDYEFGSDRSTLFQDGQAVLDQMVRTLRQAKAFSGVTASTNQAGYITYTSADDVTEQFKLNTQTGELEYGQPASLSALTGNVSSLAFTCYDTDAVALTGAVEPASIKSVQIEITLTGAQNTVSLTSRVFCPIDNVDSSLIVWWKFDENGDDSSGNGNHATIEGNPTWGTEDHRYLDLDGTGDYVDLDQLAQGAILLPYYTISVWYRIDGGANKPRDIFSATSDARGLEHGVLLEITHRNRMRFLHRFPFGGREGANVNSPRDMTFDVSTTWHHVAGVRASDDFMALYIDGVLIASNDKSTTSFDEPLKVVLGTLRPTDRFRYWDGGIDDVLIYDRGLSAAEITAIFNEGPSN